MADDNLLQQYLRPPKSVMEYTAEYDAADARKQTLRQNALELAAGQQKYDDGVQSRTRADQLRQTLMGLPQGATDDQRIQAMRGLGTPEAFTQADSIQKTLDERRKAKAAVEKDDAETAVKKLAQSTALHNFQAQKLATVQSPADALAWAEESHALGLFSQPGQYEQGVARIQAAAQDPQAFAQWKAQAMRGGQSVTDQLKQQLEQLKQQEQVRQFGATDQRIKSEGDANRAAENTRAAAGRTNALTIAGLGPDGAPSGDVETMAQGIAAGKLAPINGFALAKPRGQAIMARVMEINPSYDAGDYAAKNAALKGFSTGKEGTALRSFSVAVDHLTTLGHMADALDNGDIQVINKVRNTWKQQTGAAAPTDFKAVKEIVGKEVVKAIIAGGGGVDERKEMSELMADAKSPQQLKGVVTHFLELMGAQRDGLLDQYERTTGRKDGKEVFSPSKKQPPETPAAPALPKGWKVEVH